MAFNGGFAGGLADGLFKSWRLQEERRRTDMQAERDQRLNKIQDLQIAEAEKKALEDADLQKFETDAAEIMGKVGETDPYSVGGLKFGGDKGAAQQHAAQASQANLRRMDNAMEAFNAGTTPAMEPPALTDDKVLGTGKTYGRQQAFDDLTKKAGEYGNLGAGKAQQVIRGQYAQRAFDVIQKAATLPDQKAAMEMIVHTIDSIPDGRRVTGRQTPDGKFEIAYVDEATGQIVGKPTLYKSPEDAMYRYASSLTPEGMTKYFEQNVKSQDLEARLGERLDARMEQIQASIAGKIDAANAKNGGGSGAGSGAGAGAGDVPGVFGPFKDQDAVTKFINSWVPSEGSYEPMTNENGEAVELNPQQLRNATERNFMALLQHAPGVPPAELADVAYATARHDISQIPAEPGQIGSIVPTIGSDGRISRAVIGRGGRSYPTGTMTDAEAVAAGMSQEAVAAAGRKRIMTAAQAFQRAESDPTYRAGLVHQLGGEQNYVRQREEARAAAARVMQEATQPPATPPAAAPATAPASGWSPADMEAAKALGATPPRDIPGEIAGAAKNFAGRMDATAKEQDMRVIENATQRMRTMGELLQGDAQILFLALSANPQLRNNYSAGEIAAIEMKSGRKFQ